MIEVNLIEPKKGQMSLLEGRLLMIPKELGGRPLIILKIYSHSDAIKSYYILRKVKYVCYYEEN